MPWVSGGSGGGGLAKLFDSTLSGAAASIDSGAGGFSTSFDLLQIFIIARTAEAVVFSTLAIVLNNDTGLNYDYTLVQNRNTTVTGAVVAADTKWGTVVPGASAAASYCAVVRVDVPGYGQTTFFKTGVMVSGDPNSAAASEDINARALAWRNTAAINRVAISVQGGPNLVAGSRLLIYGT